MSRYEVPSKTANTTVAVGWDRPMRTFFGQVHRTDVAEDEEDLVFWVGGSFDEIKDVTVLASQIASYAELAPDMLRQLADDQKTGKMA